MKLRQKATILFVSVFLMGILGISLAYLHRSKIMNEQLALTSTQNETDIIRASVYARLDDVSGYYNQFNASNIGMYLKPYGEYYVRQGVYLQLWRGSELLYSSFAGVMPDITTEDAAFFTLDGVCYLACRESIVLDDGQTFDLLMIRDIQYLTEYQNTLLRFSIMIAALSTIAIGFLSFVLLRRLTKPLADLGKAAQRIAGGEYKERVRVSTKDEVGQFAETFNTMAESVEGQIREMDALVQDHQQFVDHLAHEIRTPITAMIGYSQILMHAKATDVDRQKAAEYIGQQSMRLKLLSEKLLNLSRLKYDAAELSPVSLPPILHAAASTLQSLAMAKELSIKICVPDVVVLGDAVLLETLFQNLLENAIHASEEGQEIEATGAASDGILHMEIIDRGIGIDEENLQRIIEPFTRVDAARSRQHGGVGIGLALCKRICELHHTTLSIASIQGQGTTVKVDLTIP